MLVAISGQTKIHTINMTSYIYDHPMTKKRSLHEQRALLLYDGAAGKKIIHHLSHGCDYTFHGGAGLVSHPLLFSTATVGKVSPNIRIEESAVKERFEFH